jgi:hypothetical protein
VDGVANDLGHFALGCAIASARDTNCARAGFGAVGGHLLAEWMSDGKDPYGMGQDEKNSVLNNSKLGIAMINFITGASAEDINSAANAADNAVRNNYLNTSEDALKKDMMKRCTEAGGNRQACEQGVMLALLDMRRDEKFTAASEKCRTQNKCSDAKNEYNKYMEIMDEVGSLSSQYESDGYSGAVNMRKKDGDGNYVCPSSDPGGCSYGLYQIETKKGTMQDFMNYIFNNMDKNPYYETIIDELTAAGGEDAALNGNKEFVDAWQKLANDPRFAAAQHEFIGTQKYQSAYDYALKLLGVDTLPKVIQDVIWSGAVQHGKVISEVIDPAWSGLKNPTNEDLINAFYDEREDYVNNIKKLDSKIKESILDRYADEREEALDKLKKLKK